jgi:Glycosyl transferase family 2
MLGRLLETLALLDRPSNATIVSFLVDNDSACSSRGLFETHAVRIRPMQSCYAVEPRRGIPFARNLALEMAQRAGADLLCFVDDDEFVDRAWLKKLIDCYRRDPHHLIGGPVLMGSRPSNLTVWQSWIHAALTKRAKHKAARAARLAAAGRPVTVITNNWLCDVRWLAEQGLAFDVSYSDSGGSDTALFRAAVGRNARHAWCPEAIVYESIHPDRLSLRYHFRRSRAQSITHFHQKYGGRQDAFCRVRTVVVAMLRIGLGALAIAAPIAGTRTLVAGARSVGWGVGRIAALHGRRSNFFGDGARSPDGPSTAAAKIG